MTAGSRAWRGGRVVLRRWRGRCDGRRDRHRRLRHRLRRRFHRRLDGAASGSVRNDIGATEVSAEPGTSPPMLPMKAA